MTGTELLLAVFGAMVFYKIAEALAGLILPLVTKKKKKPIDEIFADDALERKKRQAALDGKLGEIEASVGKVFSVLADHEEFAKKISQGTLENMLFNEDLSAFRRLKAFLRLVAMRANGRVREKGFALVLQYKEDWRNVLEARGDLEIADREYFNEVLEDIDKRIFRY